MWLRRSFPARARRAFPARAVARAIVCVLFVLGAGCVTTPTAPEADATGARELAAALVALDASVDAGEATRLAEEAYRATRELAADYRMVRPSDVHNLLVNVGLRERGLCCDWAHDMLRRLAALEPRTLELHWVVAHQGKGIDEHNSALVTPRGAGLERGIVIDGWRDAGRLVWAAAATDRYPWRVHPGSANWQWIRCERDVQRHVQRDVREVGAATATATATAAAGRTTNNENEEDLR